MIREPRSEFIGRRDELDLLADLIGTTRLITLTGVGGVGKTRLAIRAANAFAGSREIALGFVPLDTVEDPSLLPLTVVRALRLTDQSARDPLEIMAEAFADRDLLIVLDNCEHLIEAAARFADELLDALPRLRIIATSRRPLELVGEHIFAVPPLSLGGDDDHVADARKSDALGLLVARAKAAGAPGQFSGADAAAALELCRSLDGLPLAIELAATRLRTLSVDDLVARLSSRFTLLQNGPRTAVERQRTLRAVVDWSFELCDGQQRALWAALSVFSGSFDLAAATAVAGLPERVVVDTLDQLVSQSIVEADFDTGRFRMLETIRNYGRERAEEESVWTELTTRHVDHIRTQAADMRRSWWGPGQADKLGRLRADRAELQSALATAESTDTDAALELFSDLRYHWVVGGFLREGRAWAPRVLALADADPVRRVPALVTAAWVCLLQGDLAQASGLLDEAEAVARGASGADAESRHAVTIEVPRWRGTHAMFSGEPDVAHEHFEASIRAAMEAGLPAEALLAQFQLTTARSHLRRDDAAAPAAEALALAESIGETWMRSHALWSLALAAFVQGDLDTGEGRARDALMVEQGFDDPVGLCLMVEVLAWIDARRGRSERAATLLGVAATQWRRIGSGIAVHGPQLTAHHDECEATVRERLGARVAAKRMDEGAHLTPQEAVPLALAPSPAASGTLSARERDVASGIHRGLSNREIGNELVLSVRTVDTHVLRIFAKLGVTSRAQVAAWYESAAG